MSSSSPPPVVPPTETSSPQPVDQASEKGAVNINTTYIVGAAVLALILMPLFGFTPSWFMSSVAGIHVAVGKFALGFAMVDGSVNALRAGAIIMVTAVIGIAIGWYINRRYGNA